MNDLHIKGITKETKLLNDRLLLLKDRRRYLPVFKVKKYCQQESGKNMLNKELYNYCSVPNNMSAMVIKPRTVEWVVHLARMRTM
jgi:hypothetical protein